jgi:heat shock protein HslJ
MLALRCAALLAAIAASAGAADAQPRRPSGPPQQQGAPPPRQEKPFPVGATWIAVSLNGKPFSGDRPSFTLNQQYRATGFGGCNNYSATAYPLREQTFAVGPFALTRKECSKEAMAVEQSFLVALRTSAKWEQQGSALIIKTQSGGELRFEKAL